VGIAQLVAHAADESSLCVRGNMDLPKLLWDFLLSIGVVHFLQWDHPSMVMVVYDVTSETSFSSCEKWLEQVRAQKPGVKFPGWFIMQNLYCLYCCIISSGWLETFLTCTSNADP